MTRGIVFGLIAAALWGLTYVLPLYIANFGPVEISCVRYFSYGLFSICMWQFGEVSLRDVPRFIILRCFQFAIAAYLLFYILHVVAIKLIGAGFATLIIAFLPVSLSIYSNFLHRDFPFRILLLPLLLSFAGQLSIHFTEASFDSDASQLEVLTGVGAGLLAVIFWSWYGCESGRIMRSQDQIGSVEIANLIGMACCVLTPITFLAGYLWNPESIHLLSGKLEPGELTRFLLVCAVLGIVTSWLPSLMWQKAVKRIPVSLAGQLLVFEICMALVYIYLYDWRLPTQWEMIGAGLVLGGVSLGIYRTTRRMSS